MTVSVPNPLLVDRILPGFLSNGDRTFSRGVPLSLVKSLFCLVGQKIRQESGPKELDLGAPDVNPDQRAGPR